MDLNSLEPTEPTDYPTGLFTRPEPQYTTHTPISPSPFDEHFPQRSGVVLQLPNETLCAIFDEGRRVITAREGSWLMSVSHVCRRWRDVAIHTPFLWTNIYFGFRSRSPKALEYIQTCLERSRNCPLNIKLRFGDNGRAQEQKEALDRLCSHLDVIIPHTNRWRTLDVHLHHSRSLPILLDRLPSQVAILKHIRIELEDHVVEPFDCIVFSKGAPMLESVELHRISYLSCGLPLFHLTSLVLTRSGTVLIPAEFRMVLTTPSCLRELSLLGDTVSPGIGPWASIQLPHLTTLTLHPGAEAVFTHLCNALVTPALKFLALGHFSAESIRILTESLLPYSPRYPKLRMLELSIVAGLSASVQAQIISLLKELPMITELALFSFDASEYTPLLQALHCVAPAQADDHTKDVPAVWLNDRSQPQPAKRLLLPILSTIGITPIDDANIAEISELISSRKAAGHVISCLKTSSYDRFPQDQVQWLREHVRLDYH